MEQCHFKDRQLYCREFKDAVVCPCIWDVDEGRLHGGVICADGQIVTNSGYHDFSNLGLEIDCQQVSCREEEVLYIGCFIHVWGHVFTDCFAKLWYLTSDSYKHNPINVVYITVDGQPLKPYFKKLFEIAGFDVDKWEQIKEPTQFKCVYVPDNSFYKETIDGMRFYTKEYLQLVESVKSKYVDNNINCPQKVYFTRTGIKKSRKDFGEKFVEKYFRKNGYKIIAPEDYAVEEQLKYLANCKIFASTEGSISHNAIFCRPGTKVYILKKAEYKNGYQPVLNELAQLNVSYINVGHSIHNDKKEPWQGPFFIYPTRELKKIFGLKDADDSLLLNTEWWRYKLYFNPITLFIRRIYVKTKNSLCHCNI